MTKVPLASGKYECAFARAHLLYGMLATGDFVGRLRGIHATVVELKIKACLGAAIELTVFDCVEMLSYILFYMYNK